MFSFTPKSSYNYYLEVNLGTRNGLIRRQINPILPLMLPSFSYEITFSIDNANKVLDNGDDLEITFITNELASNDDTYYISLNHKETTLYSQ